MRKITILEHMSLDGVIQAPGGPEEDLDGGFEYGGWSAPFAEAAIGNKVLEIHAQPFDLLLGRRTYDIWAAYWPFAKGNIGDGINKATKYVATHRPDSLAWGPVAWIGADMVEGISKIKEGDGLPLLVWGSSALTPVLLEHGLADEVILFIYPILLGKGKRMSSEGYSPRELTLLSSQMTPSGVAINTYRPAGRVRTGSYAGND
ncbi:MAG: dihydrofolate reductase family protein [Chitinophagales bacterium]|nr:dihydrofolate reductase family protein [Chitinophagales bacterium]